MGVEKIQGGVPSARSVDIEPLGGQRMIESVSTRFSSIDQEDRRLPPPKDRPSPRRRRGDRGTSRTVYQDERLVRVVGHAVVEPGLWGMLREVIRDNCCHLSFVKIRASRRKDATDQPGRNEQNDGEAVGQREELGQKYSIPLGPRSLSNLAARRDVRKNPMPHVASLT